MKIDNKVYPENKIIVFLFIFIPCMPRATSSSVISRIVPGYMHDQKASYERSTPPTPCDKMAYRPHLRIQSLRAQSASTLNFSFLSVIPSEFCVSEPVVNVFQL